MPIHLLDDDLHLDLDSPAGTGGRERSSSPASGPLLGLGLVGLGNGCRTTSLQRLIGDAKLGDFWESSPLLATGLGPFDDVFSVAGADQVVSAGGLRLPYFRMLSAGTALPTEQFTRDRAPVSGAVRYRSTSCPPKAAQSTGPRPVDGLMDPARVNQLIASGATLALLGLRAYWPDVDRFCRALGEDVGHPIHANAYLTPPGERGAGPHWDMHSVFIRQVSGAKRWLVSEPVEKWPRATSTRRTATGTPLVGDYLLEPGDCLYIPRGFIHDGQAVESSPSTHITFGLYDPTTWIDWMGEVLFELSDDERWREILPPDFHSEPAAVERALAERRDLLIAELTTLDVAATAARIMRAQSPAEPDREPARLRSLMSSVESETTVCAELGRIDLRTAPGDSSVLVVTGAHGSLRCPRSLHDVLLHFLDGRPHQCRELYHNVDEESARRLVLRLIACGALAVR